VGKLGESDRQKIGERFTPLGGHSGLSHLGVRWRRWSFKCLTNYISLNPSSFLFCFNSSRNILRQQYRVTPALRELHWLPVAERIQYKLCLLVHKSLLGQTHAGIYLRPSDIGCLHCVLHRVATSSCRGHVDELATEPFLLLHREHRTGYRRS